MTTNYARFRINGTASTQLVYEATNGQSLAFDLELPATVLSVTYAAYDPADAASPLATLNAPSFVFSNSLPSIQKSPASAVETTAAPFSAGGAAWIIRATAVLPGGSQVFERKVIVRNGQYGLVIPGETTQGGARGWADEIRLLASAVLVNPLPPVNAATTAALPSNNLSANTLTATANGALASQDGVAPFVGMRLLVKDEASALKNGVYRITAVGSGGAPWSMVRDTDADTSAEFVTGQLRFVAAGTLNGGKLFVTSIVSTAFVLNTDAVAYFAYSLSGVYDVKAYGAVGDGSINDTTAIANAISAATAAGGGIVRFPKGTYSTNNISVTATGVRFVGDGEGVSIIKARQSGLIVTFSGCTACSFEHLAIERKDSLFQSAGGYSLTFLNCERCWTDNARISYGVAGIDVRSSNDTHLRGRTIVDHISCGGGQSALRYIGTAGVSQSNRCRVDWLDVQHSYNGATHVYRGNWAISTNYAVGDIVFANDRMWEATAVSGAGTSAGSGTGPSAIPGTDGPTAYTTGVTDNLVTWKFLIGNCFMVNHDNDANDLELERYDSIGPSVQGLVMTRSNGAVAPTGLKLKGGRIRETIIVGISLDRGSRVFLKPDIKRVWGGAGITQGANHGGEVEIFGGRIEEASTNGLSVTTGVTVVGTEVIDCSQAGSGAHAGVVLNTNAVNIKLLGITSRSSLASYGILSGTATKYTITDCAVDGNVTGGISHPFGDNAVVALNRGMDEEMKSFRSTANRKIYEFEGRLQTTNNTATTIATITIPANSSATIRAEAKGIWLLAPEFYTYFLRASAIRGAGGAVVSASPEKVAWEDAAGADANINASGNDVRLQVTGIAATTVEWWGRWHVELFTP